MLACRLFEYGARRCGTGKKSRAEERESDERRPQYGKTFILPYDRIAPAAPFFSSLPPTARRLLPAYYASP